jgi:hypothetical protein
MSKMLLVFQIYIYFFPRFASCRVTSTFVIYYRIKFAKHIWDLHCHLAEETGSLFSQLSEAHRLT